MVPESTANTAAAAAAAAAAAPQDEATKPTTPSKPKATTHQRFLPTQKKKEKKRVVPILVAPIQPPPLSEKSPRTKAAEAADRVHQGYLKFGYVFEKEAAKMYHDPDLEDKQPSALAADDDDAVACANALLNLNPLEDEFIFRWNMVAEE